MFATIKCTVLRFTMPGNSLHQCSSILVLTTMLQERENYFLFTEELEDPPQVSSPPHILFRMSQAVGK